MRSITQVEAIADPACRDNSPEIRGILGDVFGWRPVSHPERCLVPKEFAALTLRHFMVANWPWVRKIQRFYILRKVRDSLGFGFCANDCWHGVDKLDGFNVACVDKRYIRIQGGEGVLDLDSLEEIENLPGPHTYSCIIDIAPLMIGAMKALEERRNVADAQKRDEPRIAE